MPKYKPEAEKTVTKAKSKSVKKRFVVEIKYLPEQFAGIIFGSDWHTYTRHETEKKANQALQQVNKNYNHGQVVKWATFRVRELK